MTSPNTSMQVSGLLAGSGTSYIDALVGGTKWGDGLGIGASISYSFAYANAQPATWYADPVTGQYSADNEPSLGAGLGVTEAAAARGALQQWAHVANLSFNEVSETPTNVGDIRFAYTSVPAMDSATWGWAYLPAAGSPLSGDVWINAAIPGSDPDWSVGSFNFVALMHEIGHTLGLQHPFEATPPLAVALDTAQYTVMSYTDHPHAVFRQVTDLGGGAFQWQYIDVQPSTPMLYDIAAVQYIYGANMSYATGNDVYSFDTVKPFFETIWDAGGNDTISIVNFSRGSTIDLHEGAFSSIRIVSDPLPPGQVDSVPVTYDGTDNLAIAFGAKIENAVGGAGDDTLTGNALNNRLEGNAGNDLMFGDAGNDTLIGGSGDDLMNGGAGIDTASYVSAVAAVTVSLALATAQNTLGAGSDILISIENLTGSNFNDTLSGDGNANVINGGLGNDTLAGGLGNDTYIVNSVGDVVSEALNAGIDTVQSSVSYGLAANLENLTLTGSAAINGTGNALNNVIFGNAANNVLNGGAGVDTVSYANATAAVTVDLSLATAQNTVGAGTDTLLNFENLTGSSFNDTLSGDGNANVINGGLGNDTMDGGAGTDTAAYANAASAETASLATGGAGNDTLLNFENLTGSSFNDALTGNTLANVIIGGLGNDTLDGGAGVDTASYATATSAVTVDLSVAVAQNTVGAGTDTLLNFENLTGSSFNDTLTGDGNANVINGGLGNDTLAGGLGNDTYIVNATGDVLSEALNAGIDTVQSSVSYGLAANLENLTLTGSAAINGTGNALANTIVGNAANNVLNGSGGADTLSGGAGADVFVFNSKVGADTITDFASGTDQFRFSQAGLHIGNGDTVVDGGTVVAGPGGFAAAAELVIVQGNIAGAINAGSAAAAIGSANTAYAPGATALFAVDNGVSAGLYLFTSSGNDAGISSTELTLLGVANHTASTALGDYQFVR